MKTLLDFPIVYLTLQTAIGAKHARKICLDEYAHPVTGERVLDVGCGPGFVIDYLPPVEYVGTDIDSRYIRHARQKYGDRGQFHEVLLTAENTAEFGTFDLILLNGVVHHIDDAGVRDLFRILASCLRENGRVMTLDGCYSDSMSPISRFLINNDRGEYVRHYSEYPALASGIFSQVTATHRRDLFRFPYDAVVMVCRNPCESA